MNRIRNIIKAILLIAIVGITLLALLDNNTSKVWGISGNQSMQNDVREIYLNYCAGCHGENLEKFQKSDWMYGDNNDAAIRSIKYGREDIGMPTFTEAFTDKEIRELAVYVRSQIPLKEVAMEPAITADLVIKSDKQSFVIDTIVSELDVPWGMEFLPNGDMLIAERAGILYRYSGGKLHVITGLPAILAKGQGGLMDLRLHPEYKKNGWLYFSYSQPSEENPGVGNTAIMRAKLSGNMLLEKEVVFEAGPDSNKGQHWGCKLQFDKEGYLWFGVGDRGDRDVNPQSLDNHCGKIHRINDDGTIPEDNPFVKVKGAMPSIYSFGHRNPQGTSMHPETGRIWETEHGPRGGDELNLIEAGKNYGWPVISYGINYNGTKFTDITEKEGMEQPVTYWVPSIAPCGMTFVDSDRYLGWKNNIMIGSLRFKYLERVELDGEKVVAQERLLEGMGRVRNVEICPAGFIYVAFETPGYIVKLLPVN